MPKTIELTVEIAVQRVSCPGVWLCQDGRVSLTMFALGTSYQTCLLPPTFPLMFKDVFYFRKRFQESCALNNICCLLKEESIYCELLQWCEGTPCECEILAQYLGGLNDVLFPPNMCSNDGVDLLMRRSKDFPGILSPKIEIATKVRIDEVWNQPYNVESPNVSAGYPPPCREDHQRQMQQPACHSANFHRKKCSKHRTPSVTRSRSRSRSSTTSRSCCSLTPKKDEHNKNCFFPKSLDDSEELYACRLDDDSTPKTVIESRYIEHEKGRNSRTRKTRKYFLPEISLTSKTRKYLIPEIKPCVCEICKRYHELFHMNTKSG